MILYWMPRLLSILFIAFLSLFALDVFDENLGFWGTLQALLMHLIPCFILLGVLLLAWRREWIGAVAYALAGLLHIAWVASMSRPVPAAMRVQWALIVAGPALLISALFLVNWRRHSRI